MYYEKLWTWGVIRPKCHAVMWPTARWVEVAVRKVCAASWSIERHATCVRCWSCPPPLKAERFVCVLGGYRLSSRLCHQPPTHEYETSPYLIKTKGKKVDLITLQKSISVPGTLKWKIIISFSIIEKPTIHTEAKKKKTNFLKTCFSFSEYFVL